MSAQEEQDEVLIDLVKRMRKWSPEKWARSRQVLHDLLRQKEQLSSSGTPDPSGTPPASQPVSSPKARRPRRRSTRA